MIDLRVCKPGDRLLSKHGWVLTYVGPLPEDNYYDHEVRYHDGSKGTRIHDGHVYRKESSRLPEDHDIVAILPAILDYVKCHRCGYEHSTHKDK
jgi:hypothetical protein